MVRTGTVMMALVFVAGASVVGADMEPVDYLSGKSITVRQDGGNWVIEGKSRTVTLGADMSVSVASGGNLWRMRSSQPDELTFEADGKRSTAALTSAAKIEISPYDTGSMTGVKIDLGGFTREGRAVGLSLQLRVCLEGRTEELVFDVLAGETGAQVKELRWPKAFEPKSVDATVIPAMQGILLPRDWPSKTFLYDPMVYGRGLYMPWWGHQTGKAAAGLIIETPEDAGCVMEHPAGGPTLMELRWMHSLGKLGYPRRARVAFFDEGDYVTIAKRYRRYVIEKGRFVSLDQKIAARPIVERIIGVPVVHTGILYHIQPESSYFDKKDAAKNHQLVTFDATADMLKALSAKGVKAAYVHLDGWGFRGYDNLHPDIIPPSPEAGGWDGMKRLADTCDRLGYVFAIHDQYRDYYLDAASYSESRTVINESGGRPYESTWYGGKQSILCSSFAPGYVRRNHRELLDHGVKVKGAYLDVFAVVAPDECYSPEHPVTRADCLRYRGECFEIVKSQLGIVSSEEPADYAVRHLDLVHHGPYPLDPGPGSGPAMGIPVPLFGLVYHDAIVLPWTSTPTKGGWGIPNTDSGYTHCLLNAGIPYISLGPDSEELKRVEVACALHRKVGLLEMTNHEFLDQSRRKQRTTYADGTTVTVDFDSGDYKIEEAKNMPTEGQKAPGFSLPTIGGKTISLADYAGKQAVVLYFYPKDNTPGCTKEACYFRDLEAEFAAAGAVILGVSTDSVKSHEKFAEKFKLPFPLLADESQEVVQAYGVWKEKSMYGKSYMGIERTTFVIDKQGVIRKIWPKVSVEGHADEVLEVVKGL